jgi:ribosomal protein S18 acetylase RimI-like enzyme
LAARAAPVVTELLSVEPRVDPAAVRAMEERGFNAWPAPRSVLLAGWSLRFAGGYTRRANSMNAVAPTSEAFADVLAAAMQVFARENLPAVVRLTPLAGREPERALARAGWRSSEESLVLAGAIDPSFRIDDEADASPTPTEAWLDGVSAANGYGADRRLMLSRITSLVVPDACYLSLPIDGRPAAHGFAVAERGMVCLLNIVTAPAARRRGAARRLLTSLMAWGRASGATTAFLGVSATNEPAVRLYRSLGFGEAYRYHYRAL